MNYKTWFRNSILVSVFLILLVASFVYVIDPYQQYRKATLYPIAYEKERYLNAGLGKNFNYDGLIIGSSMTENFLMDDVKNILCMSSPIKMSISGATAREEYLTLNNALNHSDRVKTVLFGLDIYTFAKPPYSTKGKMVFPEFLYDDYFYNDFHYLLNIDILKESIKSIFRPFVKNENAHVFNFNRMYEWQHMYNKDQFKKEKIERLWLKSDVHFNRGFKKEDYTFDIMKKSIDINFLPIVESHPDIKFIIFYPPYSILAYKDMEKKVWLNEFVKAKRYINTVLSRYANVEIHDFQATKEITYDLNNYKDFTHYHQDISHWILERIRDKSCLITNDNMSKAEKNFLKEVKSYKTP